MKILIIEDMGWCADKMAEALEGLGEITIFTKEKVKVEGLDFLDERMPPLEKAVELIKEADVVLLDQGLCHDYSGQTLLPYCSGKKVISISVSSTPGMVSWTEKLELVDRSLDCRLVPKVAEGLRSLVVKMTY